MAIINYYGFSIDTDKLISQDMPNQLFKEIFDMCGAETAASLLCYMAGNTIQVPAKGLFNLLKRVVLKEYDGTTTSIRKIARDFNTTDNTVRIIIKDAKLTPPSPNQTEFEFEY